MAEVKENVDVINNAQQGDKIDYRIEFKVAVPFEKRHATALKMRNTYPDRVPIIVERLKSTKSSIPYIENKKFLAPVEFNVAKFQIEVFKRISLESEDSLTITLENGRVPNPSQLMGSLYDQYKDNDGFLYLYYSGLDTFGQ